MGILYKVFDGNKRELRSLRKIADKVEGYKETMAGLDDASLQGKTDEFKETLAGAEDDKAGEKLLDQILPEASAVVREASKRTLGLEPYPVQIMGGAALHKGDISEMKTGEGKTLTAT